MVTYIKVPSTGEPYRFPGPNCTLKLQVCGSDIVHPEKGEMKVFYPAAKAANDSGVRPDGTMFPFEPFNDTFVRLGAIDTNWAKASNRFHSGFEVPEYLLKEPQVREIIDCLRRAPGALVRGSPFPEPEVVPYNPYPGMPREKDSRFVRKDESPLPF